MALNVHPGYRGYAKIDGIIGNGFRFSDANITAKQEIMAPDLIMGDWDHDAYTYGPITVDGSISGPVTETFANASGIFGWGAKRTGTCGELDAHDVTLYYYCGGSYARARTFSDMYVNNMNFSCAAGDIANFSIDVVAKSAGAWASTNPPTNLGTAGGAYQAEKLVTWDQVSVTVSGSGPGASAVIGTSPAWSNMDFTIGNNIETVYALNAGSGGVGSPDLFPFELVPGLRTITGTLTLYDIREVDGVTGWNTPVWSANTVTTLTFNIGALSISMKVQLHRLEAASSVGPINSTVGFTGVTHQTGSPWV